MRLVVLTLCNFLVEGALRAGPDAHPPKNMHRAVIFQGAFVCAAVAAIAGLRGTQTRRSQDEQRAADAKNAIASGTPIIP